MPGGCAPCARLFAAPSVCSAAERRGGPEAEAEACLACLEDVHHVRVCAQRPRLKVAARRDKAPCSQLLDQVVPEPAAATQVSGGRCVGPGIPEMLGPCHVCR
jgi:hypothetical protein